MILKKNIFTHLFFNYYSIGFNVLWNILMIPFFLKYIPKDIYGYWLATGNVIALMAMFDPGISEIVRQKAGQYFGSNQKLKLMPLLWNSLILTLFAIILMILVGEFVAYYIPSFFKITQSNYTNIIVGCFRLSLLTSVIMLLNFTLNAFCIGVMSSMGQGVIFVFASIMNLISVIYFLKIGLGLYSIVYSILIRSLIIFLLTFLYIIYRYSKEGWVNSLNLSDISTLFSLSFNNYIGRIGLTIMNNVDSILITKFVGSNFVVNYNVSKKIYDMFRMIIERTIVSFLPSLSYSLGQNKLEVVVEKIKNSIHFLFFLIGFIIMFGMIFNKSIVTLWMGESFYIGETTNMLLAIHTSFFILWFVSMNLSFNIHDVLYTSRINIMQSFLSVFISVIGCIYWKIDGLLVVQFISIIFSIIFFNLKLSKYKILIFSDLLNGNSKIRRSITIIIFMLFVFFFKNVKMLNYKYLIVYILLFAFVYIISISVFNKKVKILLFNKIISK